MSKFKLTQTAAEVQDILNNFNGLKSDAEGNLTVGKDLGVDGKLTLKSLVSASNPDGDITKELGGGGSTLYEYTITLQNSANIGVSRIGKFYSSADMGSSGKTRTTAQIFNQLLPDNPEYASYLPVIGYIKRSEGANTTYYSLNYLQLSWSDAHVFYLNPAKGQVEYSYNFINDNWRVVRNIASPRPN